MFVNVLNGEPIQPAKRTNMYEQGQLTTIDAQIFPIFLASLIIPGLYKIMPWKAATPPSRCPACSGLLFANEAYIAGDKTLFHMTCMDTVIL